MMIHRSLVLMPLAGLLLSGCVWKSDYEKLQAQNQQLATVVNQQQQQIKRLQGAIKYTINSDLLFASGSWEMKPGAERLIGEMASKLAPAEQNRILVSGFTDNAPIGAVLQRQGIMTNDELSQKRAETVAQYLISQGLRPQLVVAKGFGESNPVAPNTTPAGRAQNRRVELSLIAAQ